MKRLFFLVFVAAAMAAGNANAADDAALEKRAQALEAEKAKLQAELSKAQADKTAAFNEATAAENAIGAKVTSASSLCTSTAPPEWPFVNVTHIHLRVRHGDFEMIPTAFAPPRTVGNGLRLQTATLSYKKARK